MCQNEYFIFNMHDSGWLVNGILRDRPHRGTAGLLWRTGAVRPVVAMPQRGRARYQMPMRDALRKPLPTTAVTPNVLIDSNGKWHKPRMARTCTNDSRIARNPSGKATTGVAISRHRLCPHYSCDPCDSWFSLYHLSYTMPLLDSHSTGT